MGNFVLSQERKALRLSLRWWWLSGRKLLAGPESQSQTLAADDPWLEATREFQNYGGIFHGFKMARLDR
jgi:hypothetical protein